MNTYHITTGIKNQLEEIRLNEIQRYLKKNNMANSEIIEICTQQFLERILALTIDKTEQQPADRQEELLVQLAQIFNGQGRSDESNND